MYMYPEKIEIVIEKDTTNSWGVYLNGVRAVRFSLKKNAFIYVEDVKRLNQGKEINETIEIGE